MTNLHQVRHEGVVNEDSKQEVGRPKKAKSDKSSSSSSKNSRFCSAELIVGGVHSWGQQTQKEKLIL